MALEDRRPGESSKRGAVVWVEALQRRDESEACDLDQIVARLDAAAVAHREAASEGQEAPHELLAGVLVACRRVDLEEILLGRKCVYGPSWRRQIAGRAARSSCLRRHRPGGR